MNKKEIISIVILAMLLLFGYIRFQTREYEVNKSRWLLGTQIQIIGSSKQKNIGEIADSAFVLIEKLENKLSCKKKGSLIWEINHSSNSKFEMDKDLFELLKTSQSLNANSEFMFDPTIGAVGDLWDFDVARIPDQDSLEIALKTVGFEKLEFSENFLKKPLGTQLNFGAIAKGYIVDRAVDFLIAKGFSSIIVNAGGDMRLFSESKGSRNRKIGVRHPRSSPNDLAALIEADNCAIVTSGDYEQFFEIDGVRYHHIINPKTGYPAQGVVSTTVIAETAELADGLSTALFLSEPATGLKILESYPKTAALIYVFRDGRLEAIKSKSMEKYILREYE